MPSYPVKSPVVVRTPASGQPWLDVRTAALEPVMAPAPGWMLYVGPGTDNPYDGNAPGVFVMRQLHTTTLHILGYLDRETLRARWGGFRSREDEDHGAASDYFYDPDDPQPTSPFGAGVGGVDEAIHDAFVGPRAASGVVVEGEVIGYAAPSRGWVRWETRDSETGARTNPLVWAAAEALPSPRQVDPETPTTPPPRASRGSGGGWLLLLGIGLAAHYNRRKRR